MKAVYKPTGIEVETTGITRTDCDENGDFFNWVQVRKPGAYSVFSVKESDLEFYK